VLNSLGAQQIIFLVILLVTFGLLLTERLRKDIVAVLVILALSVSGVLKPAEALAGFSSEPAIVVAAIFVISGALHRTGLSELIGRWIGRMAGNSYTSVLVVIMPAVALLSAFTHHLTTTAVMLPVMLNLAREKDLPPSKLLMPLSFAASLGTTITIIGAPAFLIASAVLQQAGRPGLSIFSIAPIGLSLSLVGTLFMLLVGRFLLPSYPSGETGANRFRLDQYFTELAIRSDSPFLGKTIGEIEADQSYHFKVIGWVRERKRLPRPFGDRQLDAGDVLLIRTTPEEIVAFRQDTGVELRPIEKYGAEAQPPEGDADEIADLLVQAVVAPGSDIDGRTIAEIDFRRRYGAIVVGLWRKRGWIQQEMARVKLRAGDVLVLQGDHESLGRVEGDPAFLMLVPFQGEAQPRRKATLAGLILLATIIVAAFNLLTIEIAALSGAAAMVLTGCISPRQAYRSVDVRIYIFIAGALPLGVAMQQTGTADLLAGWMQGALANWSQPLVLAVIFTIVAVLTQFMSDAATTALFAPVAVALAGALGQPPEPYVVTVAMAAVAAFLTPIGHHGNLLVYGPGRYQFVDFVRIGTPLTVLVGIVVVVLAPIIWR
jgi:di/tricarboxylate transporter